MVEKSLKDLLLSILKSHYIYIGIEIYIFHFISITIKLPIKNYYCHNLYLYINVYENVFMYVCITIDGIILTHLFNV